MQASADSRADFDQEIFGDFDVIYSVAVRLAGDRVLAKQTLQDAVLRAYRSWPSRPPRLSPKAWFFRLLTEEIDGRTPAAPEESADVSIRSGEGVLDPISGHNLVAMTEAEIRMGMDRLPRSMRRVLALSDIAGLAYTDVAMVLDLSAADVPGLLKEARSALRWALVEVSTARGPQS